MSDLKKAFWSFCLQQSIGFEFVENKPFCKLSTYQITANNEIRSRRTVAQDYMPLSGLVSKQVKLFVAMSKSKKSSICQFLGPTTKQLFNHLLDIHSIIQIQKEA